MGRRALRSTTAITVVVALVLPLTIGRARPAEAAGPTQSTVYPERLLAPGPVAATPSGDVTVMDGSMLRRLTAGPSQVIWDLGIDPGGLALDAVGNAFVTDRSANKVYEVTTSGTKTELPFTGLSHPKGVAVDAAGNVFVVDAGHNRVVEVPKDGTPVVLGLSGLSNPIGIAVDSAGTVFVADNGNKRVVKLPKGGAQQTVAFTSLKGPGDVAVDAAGDVFVSDTDNLEAGYTVRVVKLPAGGAQTTLPFSGLGNIGGHRLRMGATPTGDVYLSDVDNDRVLKLPAGGSQSTVPFIGIATPTAIAVGADSTVYVVSGEQVISIAGGIATTLPFAGFLASDVAVDDAGTVYALDRTNSVVKRLPKGSNTPTVVPFTGLKNPEALAVSPGGDIYVSDVINAVGRVVEFPAGGSQVTLGFTSLSSITGLAVDKDGNVFVTDFDYESTTTNLWELPKGGVEKLIPSTGLGSDDWKVAVDKVGNLYVVGRDEKVTEMLKTGGRTTLGFVDVGLPLDVAVGPDLSVYVTSGVNGAAAVKLAVPLPVPGPPTITAAVGGPGKTTLTWTTPSPGGAPIIGYTVTPYIGTTAGTPVSFSGTGTTHGVTGLVNGTPYRFKVRANNEFVQGPASPMSSVVVPPYASSTSATNSLWTHFLARAPTTAESSATVNRFGLGVGAPTVVTDLRRNTNGVNSDHLKNVDPVARLYFAYLLRIPDSSGLSYWIGKKRSGRSLYSISDYFASSNEFRTRYGSLTNNQFVKLVYQNVLGRAGDAGGISYWTSALDQHKKTRGQVMVGFSESNEYKRIKGPSVDVSITWQFLTGKAPTQAMFGTWEPQLRAGTKSVADLAASVYATTPIA